MTSEEIYDAHNDGEPVLWTRRQVELVLNNHDIDQDIDIRSELQPLFRDDRIDAWEVLSALGY
ncbi:MAG: hypothetical protein GC155_06185 [Alphaproteobacteria bacterium]|nr:hypothetical protein [Alphaproteobacteria bacterium]